MTDTAAMSKRSAPSAAPALIAGKEEAQPTTVTITAVVVIASKARPVVGWAVM